MGEVPTEGIDDEPAFNEAPSPDALPAPAPDLDQPVRAVVLDAVGRLVRREAVALKRAAGKPESLLDWAGGYYRDHAAFGAEVLAPSLALVVATQGTERDPAEVAGRIARDAQDEVVALVRSVPPDELPDAVGRLCGRWESRVRAIADRILGGA